MDTTRRLFLAAGSAAAVFGALNAAVVAEGNGPRSASRLEAPPLLAAIERHKATRATVDGWQGDDDDDEAFGDLASADFDALCEVALTPCRSDAELVEKLRYIFASDKIREVHIDHEYGPIAAAIALHLNS
jgi:hypothetical protein